MKSLKKFLKERGFGFYDIKEMENNIWKVGPMQKGGYTEKEEKFIANYDWEIDGAQIIYSEKTNYTEKEKQILRTLFLQKMPKELRKHYWMNSSGAKREKNNNPNYYNQLLNNYPDYIPSNYASAITPDLERTFPNDPFFKDKKNLQKMYNILLAYSRRNSTIGYCQGFNFIVGRLLQITNNEEDAFWLFVQVIETILPVEHYIELAGVMTDCIILLPFIKQMVPEVFEHLSKLGFEISINNLLYKWLVSLFTQGMNEEIWLPLWDLLFIEGYIVFFKAAIAIIYLAKNIILKFDDAMKITLFFEDEIINFSSPKYIDFLINKTFPFDMEYINAKRDANLPKVIENIRQSSEFKLKDKKDKNEIECNLDWPMCMNRLNDLNIKRTSTLSVMRPINIKNDYYNINVDLYKITKEMDTVNRKFYIDLNNMTDNNKKNILIFSNLLIERQNHICGSNISTKIEIMSNELNSEKKTKRTRKSIKMFNYISDKKSISKIIDKVDKSNFEINTKDTTIQQSAHFLEKNQQNKSIQKFNTPPIPETRLSTNINMDINSMLKNPNNDKK